MKCDWKVSPRPFYKTSNQNWAYLCILSLKYYKVFLWYVQIERDLPKYIKTKVLTTYNFTLSKAFSKNKNRCGTSLPPHFLHDFWREIFLTLYFVNWPNFIAWLSLLLKILGIMRIVIICFPDCDVINFELNLSFIIRSFFIETKSQDKNFLFSRTKMKIAFNIWDKADHIPSIFLNLPQIILGPFLNTLSHMK